MLKTILKSLREYKKPTLLAPLFIIIEVTCEAAIPFLANLLINEMQNNGDKIKVGDSLSFIILCVSLVLTAMLSLLAGFMAAKMSAKAAAGLAKNLRHDLFYKIQDFSFENIDKFSASSLVTRMTTDVSNIQMSYGMTIRGLVRSPMLVIFSTIMCFVINPQLGLVFIILIPVVAFLFWLIGHFAMPLFSKIFSKYDALNESVQENINGIRVVKNYVREEFEKEKFKKSAHELRVGFTKAELIVTMMNPILQFALNIAVFVAAILGAYIITSTGGAAMEIGGLQAVIQYGVQILMSLMFLSFILVMISMSVASAKRIAEVLNEEPTIKNPENPVMEVKNGDIEFNNVSFKYSKDAELLALNNINLKIKSGQTVGIIGSTGSAKSTLVNLISRLYDVTEGEVKVGDINVKDYDLETLRNNVSVVLQKNVLFSGTIESNLRWGNKNATLEEIKEASKIACADEFVDRFPDGYSSKIEQGGTNVSGGQKQRLCIARALLKSPKILILDDSTSAVDTKTDAVIRQGFKNSLPNTTKIIIAQRLSSVEESDMIIVMDNGTINGIGTHDELLKNNAIYQDIYQIQNQISSKGVEA